MEPTFNIHCASCGALIAYPRMWRNSLVKAPVCNVICNDYLSNAYCSYIIKGAHREKDTYENTSYER